MRKLKLLASHDEAGNIRSFDFETAGLEWQAGQHDAFVLPQAGADKTDNKRWFTIASAPSEGRIRIATRISGSAFKQALDGLRVGDTIDALDVSGKFIWEGPSAVPVVLVAGGIGITPYRSILLERAARGLPLNATLLYFNRDDAIAFRDEFDRLTAQHAELTVRYLVGEPITVARIAELAPLADGTVVYLSGHKAMVDSIGEVLKARGIEVKQDWFPGYDETSY